MKKIKYSLIILTAIFTFSCAKDKGIYDYASINDVTISGIENNNPVVQETNLVIKPTLVRSLNASEEGLEYSWTVNGKEIATTRDLDYTVSKALGLGSKDCRYVVSDTKNGMKYFQTFKIEIMNPFNWGYYFLTEREDTSTELGFISVMNDDIRFLYADSVGSIKFGNKPIQIIGNGDRVDLEGKTTYCFIIRIVTGEGEYPVIHSETATFYPSALVSSESFIDKAQGYKFNPIEGVLSMRGDTYYCSNGQLITYFEKLLYRPAKHKQVYRWALPMIDTYGNSVIHVYDEITKKYYVVKPEITNLDLGIYSDENAFDRVVPIENFPSLDGHIILGKNAGPKGKICQPTVFTLKDGLLHFLKIDYNNEYDMTSPNFEKGVLLYDKTLSLPNVNAQSIIAGSINDWFISAKNSVYLVPKERLTEARVFFTLPAELGEITSIELSVNQTKIVVTTYNPTSTEKRKGSVVFVNASTGEIISTHKNSIHKCKSSLSANFHFKNGKDE